MCWLRFLFRFSFQNEAKKHLSLSDNLHKYLLIHTLALIHIQHEDFYCRREFLIQEYKEKKNVTI